MRTQRTKIMLKLDSRVKLCSYIKISTMSLGHARWLESLCANTGLSSKPLLVSGCLGVRLHRPEVEHCGKAADDIVDD